MSTVRLCGWSAFGLVTALLVTGCPLDSSEDVPPPVGPRDYPPPAGPVVVDVAAGSAHTCALRQDGTVRCWGANHWGQLGSGPSTGTAEPRDVPGLDDVVDLSSRGATTCALRGDGTVRCWGGNDAGELGQLDLTPRLEPVAVLDLTDVVQVDVGGRTSCAVRRDGTVWCWGVPFGVAEHESLYNHLGITPVVDASDMVQVSVGDTTACSLRVDGTVWCWSENYAPVRTAYPYHEPTGVQKIALGYQPLLLFADQTYARIEHLWLEDPPGVATASDLRHFEDPNHIVDLCVGAYDSCMLCDSGVVHCFGYNNHGEAGNDTTGYTFASSTVLDITDAVAVTCGSYHNCAILRGGAVSCWGENGWGQLGDGTSADRLRPVWVDVW